MEVIMEGRGEEGGRRHRHHCNEASAKTRASSRASMVSEGYE